VPLRQFETGFPTFKIIVAVVVLLLLAGSFVQVGPGERGVLMTFGSVHKDVLAPGLHLKWPIAQSVQRMDVRIQKTEAAYTAASHDLQDVSTTAAVNWSIDPPDAGQVFQQIGSESVLVTKVIEPTVSNAVKAITAKYNVEDLIEKRNVIRQEIDDQVRQALAPYKIGVQAVNITDFKFSLQFEQAIEQKQVAQQHAQQSEYDLQRIKVEAQQKVAEAEGQAQAQKLMQTTLTPEYVQYLAVQKWNGVLPQVNGSASLPMIGPLAAVPHPTR
jgi:regulator of protease activity HflC (stomatin/prohibitin superfamily)